VEIVPTDKVLRPPNLSVNFPHNFCPVQVIIITNSDDGWVKYSCERYIPRLLPTLNLYPIVSARTHYERFYPGQPLCWKAAAFAHEVNELFETQDAMLTNSSSSCLDEDEEGQSDQNCSLQSLDSSDVSDASQDSDAVCGKVGDNAKANLRSRRREIISFGDSTEERTAVRIVSEQLNAIPKSVMFISAPTPGKIIGQLHMLTSHMRFVCNHISSLDLEISSDQAERCAQSYLKRRRIVGMSDRDVVHTVSELLIQRQSSEESGADETDVNISISSLK
jgi:hypothetical protein